MTYEYFINLDERGEFFGDVRNPAGKTVFEIHGFDIFENGFMNHSRDITSLELHLKNLKIITADDRVVKGN